jgi:hypothetical protein
MPLKVVCSKICKKPRQCLVAQEQLRDVLRRRLPRRRGRHPPLCDISTCEKHIQGQHKLAVPLHLIEEVFLNGQGKGLLRSRIGWLCPESKSSRTTNENLLLIYQASPSMSRRIASGNSVGS